MTVRIDVNSLGDEVRKCLERGEPVELERDGEIIATLQPRSKPKLVDWKAYAEDKLKSPPLDDEFEKDMALARELLNEPVVTEPWE